MKPCLPCRLCVCVTLLAWATEPATAQQTRWALSDPLLNEYFRRETQRLTDECMAGIETLDDWNQQQPELRRQLLEMLGLDPLPPRTPLQPVVTGTVEEDEFVVENLHFQSLPGLYVTGNLYRPKEVAGKLPTILYVCGHGRVVRDGVSYGNKTTYHHHGVWFARHGYVCLTIDTIQLGEIEGIHHGTHRYGMWWWNSRGYTPAGVEAWNCVRALDYLETRPDVDPQRFGITGRSGGGAYSWWAAAIDERIQAAVPVAGITNLKNHVVDGCVEGHCDCMFMVNTYCWDYPLVAALVAPRPLLISNSDKDSIFPLDGVVDVHNKARRIYQLYGAGDKLGLHITEGPHRDTQELQLHAFTWFDRWLKGESVPISRPAVKLFDPAQLKVFDTLPADERVTTIHESFVPTAREAGRTAELNRATLVRQLLQKTFRGWPREDRLEALNVEQVRSDAVPGGRVAVYEFTSQTPYRLKLVVVEPAERADGAATGVRLAVLNEGEWGEGDLPRILADAQRASHGDGERSAEWNELLSGMKTSGQAVAFLAVRGVGPTAWKDTDERKHVQIRRRFMLLGQTVDGMRVWDVRRGLAALRSIDAYLGLPIEIQAEEAASVWGLYAALFDGNVKRLVLEQLPPSHHEGPDLLNVLRIADVEDVVNIVRADTEVEVIAPASSR